MAITTSGIDQIVIQEDGQIMIRQYKRALDDDGSIIGQRFQRTPLEPGQDVSIWPQRVQRICGVVWTPAVIAAYQAAKALALSAP